MADRRKRGKKRVKRTWGKPPLRPPSLVAGKVYGELRVIKYVASKGGKRQVLVEDVKTGRRLTVRASNLASGNTTSDGRIKKERYAEHKAREKAGQTMNLDDLDPDLLAEASKFTGDEVDAKSGQKVSKVKKNSQCWEGEPDKYKNLRRYVIVRRQLQCCSSETNYKYVPVTDEFEKGGRIITAQEQTLKEVTTSPIEAPPVPYEQTDAGYYALQTYWNENKKAPPDNLDLKQWFAERRKKSA